jgi:glycosyltransferase involved in cell wall biosynthesis
VPSILFLTQYYPPETGAPQNRLSSLARHFKNAGWEVSVLTAMPNYPKMEIYAGYKGKWYVGEEKDGITIHRAWIFATKKHNIILRLLNYFSFVLTAMLIGLFKTKRHDVIFCESPPLFLGITALFLKRIKKSKLVFNVSDLWPETAKELGVITNKTLLNISQNLEERMYRKSALINGQTQGIVKNISSRFPDKKVYWLRNGIDIAQFNPGAVYTNWRAENSYAATEFLVVYGGILGYAQNLEVILRAAKKLKQENTIKILIVGDGPAKESLLQMKQQLQLDNVNFLPNQPAEKMPAIINAADAGIIPLRKTPLFKAAIPSKIFEYLIFKKPILLGVDGEAKELFIDEGNCGLFFTPQNAEELAGNILKLKNDSELAKKLGENGAGYVTKKFNRAIIADDFIMQMSKLIQ